MWWWWWWWAWYGRSSEPLHAFVDYKNLVLSESRGDGCMVTGEPCKGQRQRQRQRQRRRQQVLSGVRQYTASADGVSVVLCRCASGEERGLVGSFCAKWG
ncbi:hypothetical protein PLESTM_002061500 [Pleodorina starrii]|nr:hypothetical protein PLESTM_002061500 [Pleodorina starrii]